MQEGPSPVEFAAKLRLASLALRCNSRKELCARFRAVNPATHCDVDRMHKWMQGRALPRSMQVLDDLAAVLGSPRSGSWLGRCSLDEFVAEVAQSTGIPEEELRGAGASIARPVSTAVTGIMGGPKTLTGSFACYSRSWSPHYPGRIVRGSLRIAAADGGNLTAVYAEALAGRQVRMTGPLLTSGRVLHAQMVEPEGNLPLFLILHVPGPPVSIMSGVLAGTAFLSPDPLPSATCFVAVRVDDPVRLDATNRYLDLTTAEIAADLAALGLPRPLADEAGGVIAGMLAAAPHGASHVDQRRLSHLLDARLLD